MKYTVFFFAFLLLAACNNASNTERNDEEQKKIEWNKDDLKHDFNRDLRDFVACLNAEDYPCVIDYMPEQMLRIIPKELFVGQLEQMNEMGMRMQFDDFDILNMSDVVFHEDYYYCKLVIENTTTIALSGMMLSQKDMLIEAFELQGMEVTENESGELVSQVEEEMYAIADKETQTWKYIRFDQGLKEQIDKIIPVQVRTRLN